MEIGDKIIAIDNYSLYTNYHTLFKKGDIFTVKVLRNYQTEMGVKEQVGVEEIIGWFFETKYFITLIQYRKEKILKLKNKIKDDTKKL